MIPGQWSEWSECSKSCGGGTRTKVRECINQRDPYGNPCNVDLIGEDINASKKSNNFTFNNGHFFKHIEILFYF